MSNTFTLDALREETIRRYAPTKVELSDGSTVELRNILKLSETDRKEVISVVEEINSSDLEDDGDVEDWSEKVCESVTKILRLICKSPKKLIAELEHDDLQIKASMYIAVLSRWISESQLGEAKPSPS